MNRPSPHHSPLSDVLYCPGCNERFCQTESSPVCPRCGGSVAAAASNLDLEETLLVRTASTDPQQDRADQASPFNDELDCLVGQSLHVYQCESLLGRGGMGRVYLARHRDLHRQCALKILSPRLTARDVDYVTRFQHEGRAAASLIHPNIVTIHAIGFDRGYHFLEMEFVAGRSLQQLINQESRLTPLRATVLASQIAEGLSGAHRQQIVHRDLKPDNILMTPAGIPKIADFGLAKRIVADDGHVTEHLVGTPNFMAPELFQGEPGTPSSDVYALGVCYFLLLTGRLPFAAGTLKELMTNVMTQALPNVRREFPDISLEMAECLSLLMAKTPSNRPQDGIEAAQLLKAVLGQRRDLESLLIEAFHDVSGVRWTRQGSRYQVQLTLPDGRGQTLYIEPSEHGTTERLLLIYSTCCKADPDYYEQALRLNSEIPHGGLSIRDVDGEAHFVMIDTYPRATVDPEEVRRSALEVAYRADMVENLLTGLDHH